MSDISKLSDEQLVEEIRKKDKELFRELIIRYQNKLLRYATYLVSDNQLSTDIVQESFIKSYINLNSFNLNRKFSSWIYRIVHNQAMDSISKTKKQLPLPENLDFDSGINLEDDLLRKELQKHTHECLNQIPLIYKEPLSLFFLEEKSYEEISDILRLPIGTVGTRINRAKILMKKICQK